MNEAWATSVARVIEQGAGRPEKSGINWGEETEEQYLKAFYWNRLVQFTSYLRPQAEPGKGLNLYFPKIFLTF